jgi:cardiolipin synthase
MPQWRAAPWLTAPNLLTFARLILAPFVVGEIVARNPLKALVLLFAAGMTDLLDGVVARATNSHSALGEKLDPVADKALLSGVFLGLAWIGTAPVWFVGIVFGRDVFLLLAAAFLMAFTASPDLRPDRYGKASTALQILTAGILVAGNANGGISSNLGKVGIFFLWPTAVLTAFSGINYAWRGVRLMRRVDA